MMDGLIDAAGLWVWAVRWKCGWAWMLGVEGAGSKAAKSGLGLEGGGRIFEVETWP